MNIEIVNGRVFVEGKETVDPALIGYAVLDLAEEKENIVFHNFRVVVKKEKEKVKDSKCGCCGEIIGPMAHRCS